MKLKGPDLNIATEVARLVACVIALAPPRLSNPLRVTTDRRVEFGRQLFSRKYCLLGPVRVRQSEHDMSGIIMAYLLRIVTAECDAFLKLRFIAVSFPDHPATPLAQA